MKRNSLLLMFAAMAFAAAFARHSNVAKSSLQMDSVGHDKFMCILIESMPMFPGGDIALKAYLRDSVAYPADAKAGGVMGRDGARCRVFRGGTRRHHFTCPCEAERAPVA